MKNRICMFKFKSMLFQEISMKRLIIVYMFIKDKV